MNPITYARITKHLSKAEFARRMDCSRTYALRVEQGCYNNPTDRIVSFSCQALNLTPTQFRNQYEQFQKDQRFKSAESLGALRVPNRVAANELKSDLVDINKLAEETFTKLYFHEAFKKWREGYWNSIIACSVALCVHPASVEQYENGDYNAMPIVLSRVLKDLDLMDQSFDPNTSWCYVYKS